MKKRGRIAFFILLLMVFLGLPVMAEGVDENQTETEWTEAAEQSSLEMNYVRDLADILDYEEWEELERWAAEISLDHSCGVYILTLDDYQNYGSGEVYEVATQVYHDQENEFGIGEGRDGILLLLSMNDRDMAMFVYGDRAEYAFDEYGQETLEDVFLDDLGENDWYGGFSDYLDTCDKYLTKAENGQPVRKSPKSFIILSVVVSFVLAWVICMRFKAKMKTVHQKTTAGTYAVSGVKLTSSYDRYTHTTETRNKIEKSSDSSKKESGGGGSGRSGKF